MAITVNELSEKLRLIAPSIHPLVQFDPRSEKAIALDLSTKNSRLSEIDLTNSTEFTGFINSLLLKNHSKFGFGGYGELRNLYTISKLFDTKSPASEPEEPRRFHLGIDVWGKAGTAVSAPLDGVIHSFAFNDHFGDYGATIILKHQLDEVTFHTLYGHVSLTDLKNLDERKVVREGQIFAHFGTSEENGHWPPHLHFQVIENMQGYKGDYPGVCRFSERFQYLANCPDPAVFLKFLKPEIGI
jgi:peptidoglycan LD-endopeptidase LytH